MTIKNSLKHLPNEKGYFGSFGGRYVSETLMPLILEVEKEYDKIKSDNNFKKELDHYMKTYVGRPSPLFFAKRITEDLSGPKVYFKRDELNHTGAHKINNCMGQILLAKRMGKKKDNCRDWSRTTRCSNCNRLCIIWLTMHCLYGGKRYQTSITKCF